MSSALSNILRRSRLAHVPTSEQPFFQRSRQNVPHHQIIETKPSTFSRMEWGLKASLPSKIKTRHIVYKELDTLERMTNFEPMAPYQLARLQFQEFGIPVSYKQNLEFNPLFQGKSTKGNGVNPLLEQLDITEKNWLEKKDFTLKKLKELRPEFQKWLAKRHPEAILARSQLDSRLLRNYATEFLSEHVKFRTKKIGNIEDWNVVGSGGLSYSLKGRLKQSPEGLVTAPIAKGRFLQINTMDQAVGLGGFVAKTNTVRVARKLDNAFGDFIRQEKYPFFIKSAEVDADGKVVLDVQLVESPRIKTEKSELAKSFLNSPHMKAYRQAATAKPKKFDPKQSAMHAEELLSILTNFNN